VAEISIAALARAAGAGVTSTVGFRRHRWRLTRARYYGAVEDLAGYVNRLFEEMEREGATSSGELSTSGGHARHA
jgi:hypothetical protein